MLYHAAIALTPYVGAFNAFTYHTVRAGGAMITGFVLCLLMGPSIIRWLHRLKIGQFIKEDHVADLHALHKGKAGTPTMGGLLIILSTLVTLFIWSTLINRLLVVAVVVLCALGAVGFIDDYIKLRRRRNDGLSARAKFAGQVLVGTLLGVYVAYNPVTETRYPLVANDIQSWPRFVTAINPERDAKSPVAQAVWPLLDAGAKARIRSLPFYDVPFIETRSFLLSAVNNVILHYALYEKLERPANLPERGEQLLAKPTELTRKERTHLNRLYLEAYLPEVIAPSVPNVHTRVGVPGFKAWLLPLGAAYIFFVLLVIVGSSNAVNLTDGLDGLAVGASVIALVAFAAIAYVVSRSDWSSYLYLVYVPEASELTVFGSALLGAGLGFLWFNSHPAEVFMGDTGSLALGGSIGAMAVMTKQELLLPIVGGLFVLEALSVIVQVGYFKLTGKRVFRMAPLHHHFELKGWSETKVTIRFWILAIVFALMSLATLKLR